MAVRKIKNSWWVDFRANYERIRRRSPENSKAGAEAYEALLRQKIARGESVDKAMNTIPHFKEFALKWHETYAMSNNRAGEQANKKMALHSSMIPFFGNTPVNAITTYHTEQYKGQMRSKGLSAKTINNHLTILHTCLTAAYDWLDLKGKTPKIIWLKCPPPKTDYLSVDECGLLLAQADSVMFDMLLVALRTGMRRGEIIGLQWSSINWQTQTITVRHSQCEYTKQLSTTKSNRERHIPMDADVYTALFKRKRETGYVFVDNHKERFTPKQLSRRLKELCKKVELREIGWHTLRHTFASHLAMNGVPLNAVQTLLGHSAITTTMRYAHLAPSALRDAIGTLNPKTMLSASFGQPVGNRWNLQKQEATQSAEK